MFSNIAKIRKITVFYWLIALTVVAWAFCMLYVYSWRNNWAGKNGVEEATRKEEKTLRLKLKGLEEMDAPDSDILALRAKLAGLLLQSGKWMSARDVLTDGEGRLEKNNAANLKVVLLQKVSIERMVAICYREPGLFDLAAKQYDRVLKLLVSADKNDANIKFLKLSVLNDQAVLEYLWANASKDDAERKKHFVAAEGKFQKCLAECRFQLSEVADTNGKAASEHNNEGAISEHIKYRRLAKITADNWAELLKDLGRSSEIDGINKLVSEKLKRGA